ncbi:MAG: hypothetical protein KDK23_06275 [Leptospiraceae bacterium]|nr:hypothetical protein [Leptospiraceae bacterium]
MEIRSSAHPIWVQIFSDAQHNPKADPVITSRIMSKIFSAGNMAVKGKNFGGRMASVAIGGLRYLDGALAPKVRRIIPCDPRLLRREK